MKFNIFGKKKTPEMSLRDRLNYHVSVTGYRAVQLASVAAIAASLSGEGLVSKIAEAREGGEKAGLVNRALGTVFMGFIGNKERAGIIAYNTITPENVDTMKYVNDVAFGASLGMFGFGGLGERRMRSSRKKGKIDKTFSLLYNTKKL